MTLKSLTKVRSKIKMMINDLISAFFRSKSTYAASVGLRTDNLVQHGVGHALLHDTVMVVVSWMGAHSRVGVVPQVGVCRGRILLHFGAGQDQRSCSVGLQGHKNDTVKINDFVYAKIKSRTNVHTHPKPIWQTFRANNNINKSAHD